MPATSDNDEIKQTHAKLYLHVLKEMLILEYITVPLSFLMNSLESGHRQIEESITSFFLSMLLEQAM